MGDGKPRVEGTGRSKQPGGVIAIMAGNRLVTTETENVSILDGKSNDRTLTLLHLATNRLIIECRLLLASLLRELDAIVIAKAGLQRTILFRQVRIVSILLFAGSSMLPLNGS